AVALADVAIDFSRPEVSVKVAQACARAGKACLVATTGHTDEQRKVLVEASRHTAVLIAANTSAGVFVTAQMAELACRLLGEAFDIGIVGLHHRGKRDAPSGTAKALSGILGERRGLRTVRQRTDTRQVDELGVASLRGGDVVGDHTIYFLGRGERIELTHRATDRALFARGALHLAERLASQGPGVKTLCDFL